MSNGTPENEVGSADRMWKRHRRDGDVSDRGLSLERILRTAIEIADAQGVAELTMATIARELGFSTMALYRHVSNKTELLEIMVDTAVGSPPVTVFEPVGWRAQLVSWSLELAGAYRRHQWIFDVPVSGPPVMPNSLRWMESGLTILQQTGLRPAELLGLLTSITSFLRGNEHLLAEVVRHRGRAGEDVAAAPEPYGRMLSRVIPKGELPVLEAIIASGTLDVDVNVSMIDEHEMDLQFGLEVFLDGIQILIERCASGAGS